MADFETKLRWLSERGNPVGAEELIERIEADMSGDPLVVVGERREGKATTKTQLWPATKQPGRFRGPAWAVAAIVTVVAVAGIYLATSSGDDRVAEPTPTSVAQPAQTTVATTIETMTGIVFATWADELMSVDPGTGERTVLDFCDGCRLPAWSTDGSLLAFVRGGDVVIREMASGDERQIARCGTECTGLSLSGDASLIAYADGTSATVHDLAAGTEVMYAPSAVSDVALSPDGSELLIGGRGTLHRVRLEGGEPEKIVEVDDVSGPVYAAWSPDGRLIAYVVDVPFPNSDNLAPWEYQLWVMDADGGGAEMIWTRPGCCMRFWGGPSWSPDGTQIAAVASSPGPYTLYIVDLDGSIVQEVSDVLPERAAWRPMP